MPPQQTFIPAGKETAPVEEAQIFFFPVVISEPRTLTMKRVETDEF